MTTITLDPSQERAVAMATREPLSVVTGGPGTGKTTILKSALEELAGHGHSVALAAPTGKAAKRMRESTEREASTIHRLLCYSPVERRFMRDSSDPLPQDVVIVDEASMMDVELFSALLAAINPRRTRLVLVGDANQLPSVGPGAVLADLVAAPSVPTVRLETVHRSAAESWICAMAPRILDGKMIDLRGRPDFRFVEVCDSDHVCEELGNIFGERRDAQILIPQRTRAAGTTAVNEYIQARFNPPKGKPIKGWPELRVGDHVIHVRNNYELGVFNGECGVIRSMDAQWLVVDFGDRPPIAYSKSQAFDLRLSYALTVHKSQGSEWPWVVCVVHSTHSHMLSRQILYTAVTRGKAGVVLLGNEAGLKTALRTRSDRRNTMLQERVDERMRGHSAEKWYAKSPLP